MQGSLAAFMGQGNLVCTDNSSSAHSIALQQLQDLMKRTERKDNFEKTFEKKIRNEERRLLRLLEEEKKRRYVYLVHRILPAYTTFPGESMELTFTSV